MGLEDDPCLLGLGNFSGVNSLLNFEGVILNVIHKLQTNDAISTTLPFFFSGCPLVLLAHTLPASLHCKLTDDLLYSTPTPVLPAVITEDLGTLWIRQHRTKCHEEVAPRNVDRNASGDSGEASLLKMCL